MSIKLHLFSIRRLVGGTLLVILAAWLPSAAQQPCTWIVDGEWSIIQRGVEDPIYISLSQNPDDNTVIGKVSNDIREVDRRVRGEVDGVVRGDTISFQIFWPDKLVGVYNGKFSQTGRIEGETYDKNNTKVRQPWYSEKRFRCYQIKPKPPAATPIGKTGRSPVEPGATLSRVPGILITKPIFQIGAPVGIAHILWDGGPEHPNVEVRASINGQPETVVSKEAKGTITIQVERGKTYLYVLTDSGVRLSTTSMRAPY
jgi:hypothetical protein